jgi:hypothetical protein
MMLELQYHAISDSFCRFVPADHDTERNEQPALFRNRKQKLNAMWTPSILTFFGFSISALKPHHVVLPSHSGHRINAATPSVSCMAETQERPSFLRHEPSITGHRPLKRQDALGKRITISVMATRPWTSMIRRSNFFRALQGGRSLPQYLCRFAV